MQINPAKLGPYLLGPNDENQGIYTGDARELAKAIPDESVDLILTDPIYWKIEDYEWLAQIARRILKSGGNLIAQTCSEYRFDCEKAMRDSKQLTSCPLLIYVLMRPQRKMWKYNLGQMCKPYLWFCNGNPTKRLGNYTRDATYGGNRDKRFHEWGDSADFFAETIPDFAMLAGIVMDPFTGGGTVPAVCKMLGRRWLAFEIDPETAGRARERVRMTQPPLFVAEPEQMDLAGIT